MGFVDEPFFRTLGYVKGVMLHSRFYYDITGCNISNTKDRV